MSETPSTTKQVVGLILMVGGTLWSILAMLLSLGFLVTLMTEAGDIIEALEAIPMVSIVGAFLTGLGYVLYVVGQALRA